MPPQQWNRFGLGVKVEVYILGSGAVSGVLGVKRVRYASAKHVLFQLCGKTVRRNDNNQPSRVPVLEYSRIMH